MSDTIFIEKCQRYIDCHLQEPRTDAQRAAGRTQAPAVTLSRETGAGGILVAEQLASYLESHLPASNCPWTVFHKNLVQRVLEEHNLPERFAQFMPEDKVSSIADAVEELLGLHPASWNLVRQSSETVLHLAQLGNVILVGRGAAVIAGSLRSAFHVRLVGSMERRVQRVMSRHKIVEAAAAAFIKKEDEGRRRYLKKYFHRDIADPLLYHLILNTDHISLEEVVRIIGEAVVRQAR